MKRWIEILLCISLLFMNGCSSKKDYTITTKEDLKIIVASDLHYFSPSLYENEDYFESLIIQGDGKMVNHSKEIVEEFIQEVNEASPDLVIISGDLSFNGELISNQEMSKMLDEIECQVLVIPGNHDIDNYSAKGYGEDDYIDAEDVDSETFEKIYANQGYSIANSKDSNSCSYMVSLNDDYNIIMIDDNGSNLTGHPFEEGGYLTDGTKTWLEKQLKATKEANKIPLVVMHHNLAIHNQNYYESFTNVDSEYMSELFSEYNVPFVLSGHMHLQSIKEVNGIYDIASSSLIVNPLQYGMINLTSTHMDYHTVKLDTDLDSYDFFIECFKNRMGGSASKRTNEDALELMAKANAYYFAGDLASVYDEIINDPLYIEYKETGSPDLSYLDMIIDYTEDNTDLSIDINH